MEPDPAAPLPLAGLRVVDLADEKAELAGRLLADLGADVVRVEPPEGARSRRLPPFHGEHSLYFAVRNANKRGITADLSAEAGRQRLLDLLSGADVLIETTRPGELGAHGLDPAELVQRFGRLVVVSATDFGQTGPYRDYVATDPVMVAISGMLFRSGIPELPPLMVPGSMAYDVAGVVGAFAALAGHWQALHTGAGQHIDLSIMQAAAQTTDWSLPNSSAIKFAGGLYGEVRMGAGPVYPLYPCADGWVRLVIISPRHWRAMRAWLGEPDVLQDEHWDGLLARMSIQEDILDPMYRELFADKTMVELSAEAQRRGIVMTPVLPPPAVLAADHFVERATFTRAEVAPGVTGAVADSVVEIDGRRAGFRHRAPQVGEHDSEEVWAEPPVDLGDPAGSTGAPAPGLPFVGLRVLDFGHGGVGVEAARMFAEYGADVIKIESRAYPDFIRVVAGSEMSASFASSSRSKRSFGVNIKTAEGMGVIKRLIADADVMIENNSTGTMDEIGLGWDDVRAINPGLVMVSSQLLGSWGPWSDWLGYGPSTRTVGGLTHLWNFPGSEAPPGAFVIYPDHLVGRVCATAALAALIARSRTGAGCHVEAAQVETVVYLLSDLLLKESLEPGSVGPAGNRSERGAPWGVYPCSGEERWCVITCRHDADWEALRQAMGDPEWAAADELARVEGRRQAHDEIDRRITEWTASRTDRQVMETLQAHGVPAALMMYASDELEDPHHLHRGYIREIDQPGTGRMVLEGPAFRASGMADPIIRPAPALGEHTRQICAELLGMEDDEVAKLFAAGALEETTEDTPPPASVF
ncbi:MAG TPA: CoA transferase [Acidimicrobiales bacterium]|nr:CoA transferase [Acidimicrobiales bacterium]